MMREQMTAIWLWHERTALAVLWSGPRTSTVPVVVSSNEDLDPVQKKELWELVNRNMAVFSEKPGKRYERGDIGFRRPEGRP
jgi:hypothetical protein